MDLITHPELYEKHQIHHNSNVKKELIEFRWKISDFSTIRKMAYCVINSNNDKNKSEKNPYSLTSPVYVDKLGCEWWLKLYPVEYRFNSNNGTSIFIHTDRTEKETVIITSKIQILDKNFFPLDNCAENFTMRGLQKKKVISNIGVVNIIPFDELEKYPNKFNELNIICEIEIINCISKIIPYIIS